MSRGARKLWRSGSSTQNSTFVGCSHRVLAPLSGDSQHLGVQGGHGLLTQQGDGGLRALGTDPSPGKKSRKSRVDGITVLTSQKAGQMLQAGPGTAVLQQRGAEMGQRGELGSECTCRSSGKGKSEGSGGPAKTRPVYTSPLCRDEWRREIQLVNPEISWD